jgi:hypothetical protein
MCGRALLAEESLKRQNNLIVAVKFHWNNTLGIKVKQKDCLISIPCCIHLFGKYDFLAILPKRDRLEIRFALDRKIDSPMLVQSVPLSSRYTKNCIDIKNREEIDEELIKWLRQAYFLKDKD